MTESSDQKLVYFTVVTPKDLDYKPMENEFVELFGHTPTFIRVCDVCSNEVSLTEKDLDRKCTKEGCDLSFDVCKNCQETYISNQCPFYFGCNDPDVQT